VKLFHKISLKESVELRNTIFLERGMPALLNNGFCQSPFSVAWFGKDNHRGYSYEFCRISGQSRLDIIEIYINYGDRWIQEHLNIFALNPPISDIKELQGIDGLQFHLPPNSNTKTRLAPPDGRLFVGFPQHKLRIFFTESGLKRRLRKLGKSVEHDLNNIEQFVDQWLAKNQLMETNWEGHC